MLGVAGFGYNGLRGELILSWTMPSVYMQEHQVLFQHRGFVLDRHMQAIVDPRGSCQDVLKASEVCQKVSCQTLTAHRRTVAQRCVSWPITEPPLRVRSFSCCLVSIAKLAKRASSASSMSSHSPSPGCSLYDRCCARQLSYATTPTSLLRQQSLTPTRVLLEKPPAGYWYKIECRALDGSADARLANTTSRANRWLTTATLRDPPQASDSFML